MGIHVLERTQQVAASQQRCWDFFSNPGNLRQITPPHLDFRVLSELPETVYSGMFIRYKVRPLLGIALTWLTEITHVDAPHYFVDEQRLGPYRLWHHEHFFKSIDSDTTEIIDRVHYILPLHLAGDLVHRLFVRREVERIFDYRSKQLERIFETKV